MHELCLPRGLDNDELLRLDGIIKKRRRVLKNGYLYRMGDKFRKVAGFTSNTKKLALVCVFLAYLR
jgi:chromosome segregation and condensation protein ScpB